MTTDAWGIDEGYWDAGGTWHPTSAATAAGLRSAMGATTPEPSTNGHGLGHGHPEGDPSEGAPAVPPPPMTREVRVVRHGSADHIEGARDLVLEDGTELTVDGLLPPDLPVGYHDIKAVGEGLPTRLIVTPGRCYLPDKLRSWALSLQLHACRSERSWGIGDLGDLSRLGTWAAVRGAGMLALNPLHAPLPTDQVEASPYYPSSRRWRNPLYLQIDEIPGAGHDVEIGLLGSQARELSNQRLIDRDQVWQLKRAALDRLWESTGTDARLDRWRKEQGQPLETYARFCALADHHGAGWSTWPDEHRHPSKGAVARFALDHSDRVAFWAWVQLLLDDQMARAGQALPLLNDLAIGVDPNGAEAWALQDMMALGCRVGAPPDRFNNQGQDWGLPPFIPWKLRDAGYEPLADLWRSALTNGGGLRIDHVMGLFRLFWMLPDQSAAEGSYVRYRPDELLAVLAIESTRAGALVVGEDLGTVEDGVREALAEAGVLSTRLVWFDQDLPELFPTQAFAAVTTHDLPTVAGVWTGDDLADQRAAGLRTDEHQSLELRQRLAGVAEVGPDAPVEDVIVAVHRRLARAPSAVVAATLEDALAVTQRPNMPGTVAERPNWSLALPLRIDEILGDPLVNALCAGMREGRRRSPASALLDNSPAAVAPPSAPPTPPRPATPPPPSQPDPSELREPAPTPAESAEPSA
jgi:4-alpha-glucanotransferase